ncbi:Splicing factor YJU2 [Aphelenchoides bicaudatus]|nr:Splicing factor YJU2 [Aphelenchoides bicaudatus]
MTGTERKTFQKYYPPDFDPKKLKKEKGKKRSNQFVQRVMAPFNMQCNTCHEYIYKGKKFNMRRETAEGESYLGLKIFRFYFRCPNCLADISFKTDIENVDYTAEHGATRLFEAYKFYQEQEKQKEMQEEADKNDAMKMLEKRTQLSKAEMEAAAELGELQELSNKNRWTDPLEYLANMNKKEQLSRAELLKMQQDEDEAEVAELLAMQTKRFKSMDNEAATKPDTPESSSSESDLPSTSELQSSSSQPSASNDQPSTSNDRPSASSSKSLFGTIRKPPNSKPNGILSGMVIRKAAPKTTPAKPSVSSLAGLTGYGSSSDEGDG